MTFNLTPVSSDFQPSDLFWFRGIGDQTLMESTNEMRTIKVVSVTLDGMLNCLMSSQEKQNDHREDRRVHMFSIPYERAGLLVEEGVWLPADHIRARTAGFVPAL